jgi:hypothetical protein
MISRVSTEGKISTNIRHSMTSTGNFVKTNCLISSAVDPHSKRNMLVSIYDK